MKAISLKLLLAIGENLSAPIVLQQQFSSKNFKKHFIFALKGNLS
jgi:hypothetical protein